MVRRERDAELINRLSNEKGIHEFVARHGQPLDWEPAVKGCVILSNGEDAVQVFEHAGTTRDWQVMTIFGASCRGRRALETAREFAEWMRPHADLVFGSIPNALPHAQWFYRKLGGKPVESVESGGQTYVAQPNETLFAFQVAH